MHIECPVCGYKWDPQLIADLGIIRGLQPLEAFVEFKLEGCKSVGWKGPCELDFYREEVYAH